MEGKKRVQAKGWFLTYPQCPLSKEEAKEALVCSKVVEYVIAQEEHKDGHMHLHVFLKYKTKTDWSQTRWDIGQYHGNYQVAKSWKAVQEYCKKGGDWIANIDVVAAKDHKSKNSRLLVMSSKEAVDEGEIGLLQLPALIKAKAAYALLAPALDQEQVRGTWIWGPPGVGKSHQVRTQEPSLYVKAQNKWWDGYLGEEAVLIDDFDKGGVCLSHYLKIWGDKWKCTGEIKGGTVPLNFKRLFITSNYRINDLFGEDQVLEEAISRRFAQVYKGEQ